MVLFRERFHGFFQYDTRKYVATQNLSLGLLHRLYQLSILLYIIIWVFFIKKGYQEVDSDLQSSIIIKMKGISMTNITETGPWVWGPEDYVIPPQGEYVMFVVTSFEETPNQKLGHCAESPRVLDGHCRGDEYCVMTGRCLVKDGSSNGTCEIFGWCPTEKAIKQHKAVLKNAENFTIYIKNFIRFPKFTFAKSNILETNDRSYLKKCRYDELRHPYCPIFSLGDIIKKAGSTFQDLATSGASIDVVIKWDCDLDKGSCHPQYSFTRLDNGLSNNSIARGFNFRHARYFRNAAGESSRMLYKVYGIRLNIIVDGKVCSLHLARCLKYW
ncbi:unnamed protein product [Menidia menidia]|uniref:(Atlantic silverside) hypothetical protein n=1 Tax=Menidia menidia TaxID=238744 RepID=A0A8S4BRZ6_9TELE|nr:unnamed protein product [Menidia menidia]